jgi:hypothetical protein
MRLGLTALVLLGLGALLSWTGAARLVDAWPGPMASVEGAVGEVEAGALTGAEGRTVFRLKDQLPAFELGLLPLAYPTPGHLADSGRVKVDYDTKARIRNAGPRKYLVYAVTGLEVDGRVYFSPGQYWTAVAFGVLILALPGAIAICVGGVWAYRLSRNPRWRPRPWRWRRSAAPSYAYGVPSVRDPRKTAGGEWLH